MTDAADKTSGKDAKKGKRRKSRGRELVECLAVAGILALTIRQFGFQLFKIPTRSMEPTLIGDEQYGDRVISAMWYKRGGVGLRLAKPRRWQVIVFDHYTYEKDKKVSTNFIKRLIGLPGETVHIRDGDIWAEGPGDVPLHIERKPAGPQQDLWMPLCNLDFSAPWAVPYYWEGAGLTLADGAGVLTSTAEASATLKWAAPERLDNRFVRLSVKRPECSNPSCKNVFRAVFDTARPVAFCPKCHTAVWGVTNEGEGLTLAYKMHYWVDRTRPSVSDLLLGLDFELLEGSGELTVTLTGRDEPCTVTMSLGKTNGQVELACPRQGESLPARVSVLPGVRHWLEVQNVDGALSASLDGRPLGRCEYEPRAKPGRSGAAVSLSGGTRLRLHRIRLSRDIYYGYTTDTDLQAIGGSDYARLIMEDGHEHHSSIALSDTEYLMLGDNQLASHDGRAFGPKKERDIVARGLFVAWPPSRMHWLH